MGGDRKLHTDVRVGRQRSEGIRRSIRMSGDRPAGGRAVSEERQCTWRRPRVSGNGSLNGRFIVVREFLELFSRYPLVAHRRGAHPRARIP